MELRRKSKIRIMLSRWTEAKTLKLSSGAIAISHITV